MLQARDSKPDTKEYRQGYPGKLDNENRDWNLQFYLNEMKSFPDGGFIDDIHKEWYGDYRLLEAHHGYIQWLFPIREQGLNENVHELQLHEVKGILANPLAKKRILRSYKMMLDFYGLHLIDRSTGQVNHGEFWVERFKNMNRYTHNNLRITRILKSLGEFNLENYKCSFLEFMIPEIFKDGSLLPNSAGSCMEYWINVIKDKEKRTKLKKLAKENRIYNLNLY